MSEITKTPWLSHENYIDGVLLHLISSMRMVLTLCGNLFWEVFQVVADRLSQLQMFLRDSWDGMDDHVINLLISTFKDLS